MVIDTFPTEWRRRGAEGRRRLRGRSDGDTREDNVVARITPHPLPSSTLSRTSVASRAVTMPERVPAIGVCKRSLQSKSAIVTHGSTDVIDVHTRCPLLLLLLLLSSSSSLLLLFSSLCPSPPRRCDRDRRPLPFPSPPSLVCRGCKLF